VLTLEGGMSTDPLNDAIAASAKTGNRRSVWLATIYVWPFAQAGPLQNLHNSTFGDTPDWVATVPPRTPRPTWIPANAQSVTMQGDEVVYLWRNPEPELALGGGR
jgi:hypothetical protein